MTAVSLKDLEEGSVAADIVVAEAGYSNSLDVVAAVAEVMDAVKLMVASEVVVATKPIVKLVVAAVVAAVAIVAVVAVVTVVAAVAAAVAVVARPGWPWGHSEGMGI